MFRLPAKIPVIQQYKLPVLIPQVRLHVTVISYFSSEGARAYGTSEHIVNIVIEQPGVGRYVDGSAPVPPPSDAALLTQHAQVHARQLEADAGVHVTQPPPVLVGFESLLH